MTRTTMKTVRSTMFLALSMGGTSLASRAHAQAAATPAVQTSSLEDGEITVTARRREESLVDVPIAITAFSEATIVERGITSLDRVAQLTPGLQFDRGFSPAEIRPSLRGIALTEGRSNVAIIVDGIDVTGVTLNTILGGGGAQTAAALMDLERIEVVKGPQTVYFGRSAFAGAIQFISRDPSFETGGKVIGAIGDYGRREITAHVTGPILGDVVAAKLSGTYRKFDGWYENPGNGQHLGGTETYGVGGSVLIDSGPLRIKAQLNYLHDSVAPGAGYLAERADVTQFGVNRIGQDDFNEDLVGISSNKEYGGSDLDTYRGIINVTLDLGGGFTLNALSGLNKVSGSIEIDFDTKTDNVPAGTALPGGLLNCIPAICVGIFDAETSLRQLSQELRLSYDTDRFRGLVGAYVFDENYQELDYSRFVGSQAFVIASRSGIPARPSRLATNTYSAFGSLEYDLTSLLTLTGELRFNHEIIRAEAATNFNLLFQSGSADVNFRGRTSFDAWLPRASARYAVGEDANVYATVAKGSKPGGFNVGQVRDDLRPFEQESIWTYEIGGKGRFLDGRLNLEAALYYSDWSNVQVTTICYGTQSAFGPEAECPTATAVSLNYIVNADKAEVKGLELGASGRPARWLTLSANYAYTDSKYKDFLARDVFPAPASSTPRQFGGNRVQLIPKHSLSASARVEAQVVEAITGFVELDGRYKSSRFSRFDNRVQVDGKTVFDVSTGLKGSDWTATLFAENLFNNQTPEFTRFYGNWNPGGRSNGEYIVAPQQRSIGLRVSKDF